MSRNSSMQAISLLIASHECSNCGHVEERIFTDSWSGKELCLECILSIGNDLTNSPASEGDNIEELLNADG